jgi:hypothetical protein
MPRVSTRAHTPDDLGAIYSAAMDSCRRDATATLGELRAVVVQLQALYPDHFHQVLRCIDDDLPTFDANLPNVVLISIGSLIHGQVRHAEHLRVSESDRIESAALLARTDELCDRLREAIAMFRTYRTQRTLSAGPLVPSEAFERMSAFAWLRAQPDLVAACADQHQELLDGCTPASIDNADYLLLEHIARAHGVPVMLLQQIGEVPLRDAIAAAKVIVSNQE